MGLLYALTEYRRAQIEKRAGEFEMGVEPWIWLLFDPNSKNPQDIYAIARYDYDKACKFFSKPKLMFRPKSKMTRAASIS